MCVCSVQLQTVRIMKMDIFGSLDQIVQINRRGGKQEHKRQLFKHWLPGSLHRAKVGQAGQLPDKSSWDVSVSIPLWKGSHDGCSQGMVGALSRQLLVIH